MEALGRIEPYFNSYVVIEAVRTFCAATNMNFDELLKKHEGLQICATLAKDVAKLRNSLERNVLTKDGYHK